MRLFNTKTRKIEEFEALVEGKVKLYTCGQTVYDYTHIGHLRRYVGDDILRRVLAANGYEVKHVQNVTDVGHLTSDADEGDDKLEKGAKERNMTVWEVARFFEDYHYKSLDQLNVLRPDIVARATEHVNAQIELIQRLEKNGFTYVTDQAIYFDVSKFPDYTKLSGQKLEEKEAGVRTDVVTDSQKRNPQDFALWFFTVGHFAQHSMKWPSPWGEGFPGWHIECSAMSMVYLGETIDIHTGGIDHIPIHHTNEIAQSEAATGREFVRFWFHNGWLLVMGEKMSKSKKNYFTIDDIKAKGFDPISLRYLFLTAHYRDMQNFTWEALSGAQTAYTRLVEAISNLKNSTRNALSQEKSELIEKYRDEFYSHLNNDLGTPAALAALWEVLKSNMPNEDKHDLILSFDEVLGLRLEEASRSVQLEEIPQEIINLSKERERLRKKEKWDESDKMREQIEAMGYVVEDKDNKSVIRLKKALPNAQ